MEPLVVLHRKQALNYLSLLFWTFGNFYHASSYKSQMKLVLSLKQLELMKNRTNQHLLVSSLGVGVLIHIIYHLSVQFCYSIG